MLARSRPTYGTQDTEEGGFRLMEGWLEERGIHVQDTRNQKNVGADAVDLDRRKAGAGAQSSSLRARLQTPRRPSWGARSRVALVMPGPLRARACAPSASFH